MPRAVPGGKALDWLLGRALEGCDEDGRTIRRGLGATYLGVSLVTPLWGVLYISMGEVAAGLIPAVYGVVSIAGLFVLRRVGGWQWMRVSQLVAHLLLPFLLMWLLGGFGPSSAVLIWALLAPLSSLWAGRPTEGAWVLAGFGALTVLTALIEGLLPDGNELPSWTEPVFYVGNFCVMATVIFLVLDFFVGEHATALQVMRRNRELESAYLRQEVTLRQSEKLATVGRLSAGLAHELNNPAAAVQQSARELASMLLGERHVQEEIDRLDLPEDEAKALALFAADLANQIDHPEFVDPIDRIDRESAMQDYLETLGVEDPWDVAPPLVSLGLRSDDLENLAAALSADTVGPAAELVARQYRRQSVVRSLDESTSRIVTMVRALKSYTHLDEAPVAAVDLHEGLDSTLVMLQSRLKSGIAVERHFAEDLPTIEAHGSELNQVWTNLVDNALDAMGDSGSITLTTRHDGDDVEVAVTDSGPGIPAEVIDTIFDPFVTTKAPGDGTGLGLNIVHRIVTERHGGTITATNDDGGTTFTVRLPIRAPRDEASRPTGDDPKPTENGA